ncbi:hydroxyisourate hydrolase [Streptomyces eurythermus]|uniref:hydroxyisourate hydrolase n=1 Tax=Streptomyces eurythermus TaxID=42237 RepID=UPI0033D58C79
MDSSCGRQATGLDFRLDQKVDGLWNTVLRGEIGTRGCVLDFAPPHVRRAIHRLVFDVDRYFVTMGTSACYPEIVAVFLVRNEAETHRVCLALSPYSYAAQFTVDN